MIFAEFAERASRHEWQDVHQPMKHIIEGTITTGQELPRDTLDLAVTMYRLLAKNPWNSRENQSIKSGTGRHVWIGMLSSGPQILKKRQPSLGFHAQCYPHEG